MRLLREWAGTLVTISILLCARASLADHYRVPSGSMLPTVEIGDHLLVDKRAYGWRVPATNAYVTHVTPTPGDVVVLDSPVDERVLLKRVVAVAGQKIEVREGQLYRDGSATAFQCAGESCLEQLSSGTATHRIRLTDHGGAPLAPVVVPEGKVLVMGDNRGESFDGRYFGFVDEQRVIGRAMGIFLRGGSPQWLAL